MKIQELVKNAGTLTVGNGISQATSLIGLVVLARYYSPEQFGFLALVVGVSTITGIAASARYELTILLPKSSKHAMIARMASLAVSIFSHVVLLLVLSGMAKFNLLINEFSTVLFIVLISAGSSLVNISSFVQNRESRYATTAIVQIMKALMTFGVSWSVAYTEYSEKGLVIGLTVSSSVLLVYLSLTEFGLKNLAAIQRNRLPWLRGWLKRHIKFVKYSLPAVFVNNLSTQAPVFLLAAFYGQGLAGVFSVLMRVIMAPMVLVAGAFNRIYMRTVSERRAVGQKISKVTAGVSGVALVPALGAATVLLSLSKFYGFEQLMGSEWQAIDVYLLVFLPMMLTGFVSKSVAGFAVLGKNELGLFYQFIVLVAVVSSICIADYFGLSGDSAVRALAFTLVLTNLIQYSMIIYVTKTVDRVAGHG